MACASVVHPVDHIVAQNNLSDDESLALRSSLADDQPTMLHHLMFLPALSSTFDNEQQARWMPLARSKQVRGYPP